MVTTKNELNGIAESSAEVPPRPEPVTRTILGAPIKPSQRGLPKLTESLCPECMTVVRARIFEDKGRVMMEKVCTDHGYFKDIVWSDVKLYLKAEQWTFADGKGISNPSIPDATSCPADCGLCQMHVSHTGLANVDLTNRCDLTCPVCFANANAAGYVYEPSVPQVYRMLKGLREMRPVSGRIVQFSGGEPTAYPHFVEVVRMAKELGFSTIQVATNGLRFASEPDFAEKCADAGLHTLYLQFDGLSDEIYRKLRGRELWEIKQRAIEAVRRAGLKIVFVPTVVRGVNDHEVGNILRYAIENIDVLSGISYQPVAFTGRIAQRQREQMRYTLTDLVSDLSAQTGLVDAYGDWYPTACTSPFSHFISALRGDQTTTLTCHPHCSLGTYLFVDPQTKMSVPITRFVDVEGILRAFDELAQRTRKRRFKTLKKISAVNEIRKFFRKESAPPGLTFKKFIQTLEGMIDKKLGRGSRDGHYTYKTLLVAGMHFQDVYNYQIDRVQRCVIHYSAPDGKIYPFCAYNSGPCFREKIEREFSIPVEEYRSLHGDVVGLPKLTRLDELKKTAH